MLVSYKVIGRNIRTARKKTGMTQEQAAALLGMSGLHYGRLERGDRPASLDQLAHAAAVLGTTLSALLCGCIEGETISLQPGNNTMQFADAAAQIAHGCSPDAQALMLTLCRAVAAQDKKAH